MTSIRVGVRCSPFSIEDNLAIKMVQQGKEGTTELLNSSYTKSTFSSNHAWWSAYNYKKYIQEDHEGVADAMVLVDQEEIYQEFGTKAYQDIISGEVAVVMSYGLSGSGKTFSLFGCDMDENPEAWYKHDHPSPLWGIFPRLAYKLFQGKSDSWKITMKCFENIGTTLTDLLALNVDERPYFSSLRADGSLDWLCSKQINSWQELCEEYQRISARKSVAPTQFNPLSNRGHCFLILDVEFPHPELDGTLQKGRLFVCDLLGMEPAGDLVYAAYDRVMRDDGSIEYNFTGPDPDSTLTAALKQQAKKSALSLAELSILFTKMSEIKNKDSGPIVSVPGCNSFFLCKFLKNTIIKSNTYLLCTLRPEVRFLRYTFATLGFTVRAAALASQAADTQQPVSEDAEAAVQSTSNPSVDLNSSKQPNDMKDEMSKLLLRGKKPWRRSKIMIVGEGRAGKTALANSIIGRDFSETKSTIGINNLTCDIKYAALNGDVWQEYSKPAKELEVALAQMMLDRRLQRGHEFGVDGADLEEYSSVVDGGYQLDMECVDGADSKYSGEVNAIPVSSGGAVETHRVEASNASQSSGTISATAAKTPEDSNDVNPSPRNANTEKPVLPTPAPVIDEDLVMKCLSDRIHTESKFVISLFDFGGQSVFNVIHHFFLTKYGVYLLVFNMEWLLGGDEAEKDCCLAYLSFWLNSVVIHTQNSSGSTAPIVFVGTRKDKISSPAQHEAISTILCNEFSGSLAGPSIVENDNAEGRNGTTDLYFFPVDNTLGRKDPSIQKLLRVVEHVIDTSAYAHAEQPLAWLQALDLINDRQQAHLMYSEVVSICEMCGLPIKLVPMFLRFAHEMGVLMWHEDEELRDVVIMKPIDYFIQPATVVICKHSPGSDDSIYHSLDIHRKVKKNRMADWNDMLRRGVISEPLLLDLLAPSEPNRMHILQLMLKYGLIVEYVESLPDGLDEMDKDQSNGAKSARRSYLAPALLPLFLKNTTDMISSNFVPESVSWASPESTFYFLFAASKDLERSAVITWDDCRQFGFLPSGLFERLIGKAISWSQVTAASTISGAMQVSSLFKDEAVLSFGLQRFRLSVLSRQNMLRVEVEGKNPLGIHARLVQLVDKVIVECMKSLKFFTVLELITEQGSPSIASSNTSQASFVEKLFVRLKQVRSAAQRHSALNLVGSGGRKLINATDVSRFYQPWLTEFQVFDTYELFFSYRWGKEDSMLTHAMFELLTLYTIGAERRSIRVFLDSRRLREGRNFQQEFVAALVNSLVICPIVTPEALARLEDHSGNVEDNLLVEWILSIACVHHVDSAEVALKRKRPLPYPRIILPVVFGSRHSSSPESMEIGDFFQENWLSKLPSVVPTASLQSAERLLREHHIPLSDELRGMSVQSIVRRLLTFLCITTWTVSRAGQTFLSNISERLVNQVQQAVLAAEDATKARHAKTLQLSGHGQDLVMQQHRQQQQLRQQDKPPLENPTGPKGPTIVLDLLTVEQVGQLLKGLGLQNYVQVFSEHAIDGSTLACCDSVDELKEAGIELLMHAKKLLRKVLVWKELGVSEAELV